MVHQISGIKHDIYVLLWEVGTVFTSSGVCMSFHFLIIIFCRVFFNNRHCHSAALQRS